MPKQTAQEGLANKEIYNPFAKVSLTDLVFFLKRLALMLHSGLDIVESLRISQEAASGKLKKIIERIVLSVTSGNSLSKAMANFPDAFSLMVTNSIRAGEQSGNLPESLEALATQLDKERLLKSRIKEAMFYPTIVLVAAAVLGIVMALFILPKITPLLETLRVDLPLSTKILIAVANVLREYTVIAFTGIIGTVVGVTWLLKQAFVRPVTNLILLRIPAIGRMNRSSNLAQFCRTLGTLLQSGVNIDQAIVITSKTVDNYYFQKAVEDISKSSSTKLSENLKNHPDIFPGLVQQMVSVGEESGTLDETLLYLAGYYDEEVDGLARSLPSIIEPMVLLLIGLVVAFLALSIMTPIFKATGGLGKR